VAITLQELGSRSYGSIPYDIARPLTRWNHDPSLFAVIAYRASIPSRFYRDGVWASQIVTHEKS